MDEIDRQQLIEHPDFDADKTIRKQIGICTPYVKTFDAIYFGEDRPRHR